MTERTKQEKPFAQVCVWGSTTVGESNIDLFEKSMLEQHGIRVKYLEEIMTFPDRDANGNNIEGTGGRSDVFFAIHEDDIPSFAVPRLSFDPPVRWIEDVLGNESLSIYPETVNNYTSWENEKC
jgi:hypothetical protein